MIFEPRFGRAAGAAGLPVMCRAASARNVQNLNIMISLIAHVLHAKKMFLHWQYNSAQSVGPGVTVTVTVTVPAGRGAVSKPERENRD